jgi:hypothetical protein
MKDEASRFEKAKAICNRCRRDVMRPSHIGPREPDVFWIAVYA